MHTMKTPDPKRFPLSLRTTKQLREKLEAAAAESGRSLAQEIELRLEMSFDRQATARDAVDEALRTWVRIEAPPTWGALKERMKLAGSLSPEQYSKQYRPKRAGSRPGAAGKKREG
jgi:alkanesulfonate monooxygenase SsuD/methylene tetrahydromethanopterin reductase-like flavin-dependent oxidoreductase (luciferase family)